MQKQDYKGGVGQHEINMLIIPRLAVISLALLVLSLCTFFSDEAVSKIAQLLFVPLGAAFASSLIYLLWARVKGTGPVFVFTHLLTDILVITAAIYLTGGPGSPFLFLYLPLVMAAAIFLGRSLSLVIAVVSGAIYAALAWAMLSGKLIQPADALVLRHPAGGLHLQFIGLFSAMILISIATSYLIKRLRSSNLMVESSKQAMAELSEKQQLLFERMPDGIIMTDAKGRITQANKAALSLLGQEEQQLKTKTILGLVKELTVLTDKELEKLKNEARGELSIALAGSEDLIKIAYQTRETKDKNGEQNGTVYFFHDITRLRSVEEQLAMQERMARLLAESQAELVQSPTKIDGFVGESAVMQKIFKLIDRVAPSEATVLVSGESGTGKELVAKAIHLSGPRASAPFVPVNCGAIPETLIESELFGHKKGSFTGADRDHIGLFRQADGGTLFLDEISELPLLTQAKLLRALQEKSVRPVGSESSIPINVRIIAATNRGLKAEVKEGRFREDLFYRLNVIHVKLPPLRQRKDDIPLLVNFILKRKVSGENPPVITPEVMQLLMDYHYPGNVRELENILERAVVFGGEVLLAEHLPEVLKDPEADPAFKEKTKGFETEIIIDENLDFPVKLDDMLADIERRYLEVALLQSKGIKKKAAALLGINFRSFRYRLQKFGIGEED